MAIAPETSYSQEEEKQEGGIDIKELRERIEQERRVAGGHSSRKGVALSSEQFTFRDSPPASSIQPLPSIIQRAEVRLRARQRTLQTASEEATNSVGGSIHPRHSRYSSGFSKDRRPKSSDS